MQGSRFFRAFSIALALTLTAGLGAGVAQAKKKSASKFERTAAVNQAIPDETSPPVTTGVLVSELKAGGKYKGRKIRDVNVTVQISGTGTDSIFDLDVLLQAPNGATTFLFTALSPGNQLGPLTLDDESDVAIFNGTGATFPTGLLSPWQGTAHIFFPLAVMDGGPVKGTWKLHALDYEPGNTNTLVSWGLQVRTGKPYETK
jgi:subtilisin-like proprotein convertase family protein